VSVVVWVALVAAGCVGSTTPTGRAAIHLDGKRAQGDYVFETDASGARFLVPAPVLAGQGSQAFDAAAPTSATVGEPNNTITRVPPPYRVFVADAAAVVPHSAHVEVLATGLPGRRFALSWEETCGWTQHATDAVGGSGGQGMEILRSPAVELVKLPRIPRGVPSCYVAATALARRLTRRLRLAIIDYCSPFPWLHGAVLSNRTPPGRSGTA
jgi:hypothetical protein